MSMDSRGFKEIYNALSKESFLNELGHEKESFKDDYSKLISSHFLSKYGEFHAPLAFVRTFGCQQNSADSERIKGMLAMAGYGFTENAEDADLILFNTCAVREHAEDRVFGNVGALKSIKQRKPDTLIAVCGCMVQQPHVAERFRTSFPFVGLLFGTHVLHKMPQLLYQALTGGKRVFDITDSEGTIVEDVPVSRDGKFKAGLPIMYGCNNFCTYCVVPYVRGRERSREPEVILSEAKQLIQDGYKEIMLLGQNVNSYGKKASHGINFPKLLRMINDIEGDFLIRFMTSHPKDASKELIDTIAECHKVERHFHLPFQSGSNRILKAMNRGYTRESYIALVNYAREKIPGITFTSDVIVGFPGETYDDFKETLTLIKDVAFTSLFTFIFSAREGTPAAKLADNIPHQEKSRWFREMTELQADIAAKHTAGMVGKTCDVLIEGEGEGFLEARTSENINVRVKGDKSLVGERVSVKITEALNWILIGETI